MGPRLSKSSGYFCGRILTPSPILCVSCGGRSRMATLRHDIWASARRRAIRRAGCDTSAEPSYSNLLAPGQRGGAAGLKRGDILALLPGGRIVALDCLSRIRPLRHMLEAHHDRLGLQQPRPRLVSVALSSSLVTAQVMNSCRCPASLLEGWSKIRPVSSMA